MKEIIKEKRGITLIALVITIVILIILAGILINITLGDNGLFTRAKEGAEKYKEQQAREKVEVMLAEFAVEKEIEGTNLITFLEEQKTKGAIENYTDNGDNTITVKVDGYDIIIDSTKAKVIGVVKSGETPENPGNNSEDTTPPTYESVSLSSSSIGNFDVLINGVTDSESEIQSVQLSVYNGENNSENAETVTATNKGNGQWSAKVYFSHHNYKAGTYYVSGTITDSAGNSTPISTETITKDAITESNGNYYVSIKGAIDAAPTDGTLTTINLLKNYENDREDQIMNVEAGKNIVLDLQTHTAKLNCYSGPYKIEGKYKITNGNLEKLNNNYYFNLRLSDNGEVTLDRVGGNAIYYINCTDSSKLTIKDSTITRSGFYLENSSMLTIVDSIIRDNGGSSSSSISAKNNATMDIKGSTQIIDLGISTMDSATATVSGTTTINAGSTGAINVTGGSITLKGGTFTSTDGNTAFLGSTGTLNIESGTLSVNTTGSSHYATVFNNGTVNMSGGSIINNDNSGYAVKNYGTFNKTGGTITGQKNGL